MGLETREQISRLHLWTVRFFFYMKSLLCAGLIFQKNFLSHIQRKSRANFTLVELTREHWTALPKWKLPRWEPNQNPLAQQTLNVSVMLRRQCCLSDKLSILFKSCHAWCICTIMIYVLVATTLINEVFCLLHASFLKIWGHFCQKAISRLVIFESINWMCVHSALWTCDHDSSSKLVYKVEHSENYWPPSGEVVKQEKKMMISEQGPITI